MNDTGKSIYSSLLIVLFALYFLLAAGLAAFSAGVYRRNASDADSHYTQRTALSYLVNQARQGDCAGGISVGQFSGSDALFLRQDGYVTVLYVLDGVLRELYTEEGAGLPPESGLEILPLEDLNIRLQDELLTFTVTDADGGNFRASVRPRCGAGTEAAS